MKKFILAVILVLLTNPYSLFAADERTSGRSLSGKYSWSGEESLEKGIRDYKAENYEESIELLTDARNKLPGSSIAAFYLGLASKQTGNYREAAAAFRSAITLTPSVKDAYTELIEVLYNLNEFAEAKSWIAKAEQESVKPAHIAFLKGLILAKEGNTRNAVEAFNKAKELDKSLAQPSDLQIAMAYAKDRKLAEARESLKAVISIAPTSELANFAKEYETSLARAMEAYRTWRFTVGAAYQFDDNAVLKPSDSSSVLISGERDSAISNNFRIDYTPMMSGQWTFNGQYSFYANTYFRLNDLNVISQSITLNPGYSIKDGAVTLPIMYNFIWLNELKYQAILSIKPTLNLIVAPNYITQFSAGYAKRGQIQVAADPAEDRDANLYSFSAGMLRPFSEGKGMVNLRYEFVREFTDGQNWQNDGNRISLGLLVPVVNRLNLTVSSEAFLQDYRNVNTVFDVKRQDRTYSGSANLIWEVLKNFNLNFQYAHTRADSNIAVYDYRRNVYSAGLEYSF